MSGRCCAQSFNMSVDSPKLGGLDVNGYAKEKLKVMKNRNDRFLPSFWLIVHVSRRLFSKGLKINRFYYRYYTGGLQTGLLY